jgi:fatty-acyl-CoA synthase
MVHSMNPDVAAASALSLLPMFRKQVRREPGRVAVEFAGGRLTYGALDERAARLAALLAAQGCRRGDRVCILSENSPLFAMLTIAALRLGVVIATLNWRLAERELAHCIGLVEPRVTLVSERLSHRLKEGMTTGAVLEDGPRLERAMAEVAPGEAVQTDPEDPLFIIYTSGTTGLPKGAVLSARAMLARLLVYVTDYGVDGSDTFIAWSPLFHMASVELSLGSLLLGGKVSILDGPDLGAICDTLEREPVSNLIFFPGMVETTLAYLRERRPKVRRLKKFGALADLFSPHALAEMTALLGVPFTNTFGSTETGMPPASAGRLPPGEAVLDLAKAESLLCEVRLADEEGQDVPDGQPGELLMRGPTLFSGYWGAEEATREAFAGGWYHTGDVFVRRSDGRLAYVDRRKYLIKSGGENIYPAEIERVVATHPGVRDAVVVRQGDPRWGEVPVLVIDVGDPVPSEAELLALCARDLAPYKRPKRILFTGGWQLPRNNTGKVIRAEVEAWAVGQP